MKLRSYTRGTKHLLNCDYTTLDWPAKHRKKKCNYILIICKQITFTLKVW